MRKLPFLLLALGFTFSCTSGGTPADTETPATAPPLASSSVPVPDSEIGLAHGTAFEQPEQQSIAFNPLDPGDNELRPRPNSEFPPVIPHSTTDLETITLGSNPCLDCHDQEVAPDMGAPAAPESHQVDLRGAPDHVGSEAVGARWVCTSCHVAQTESEPLVENPPVG